MEPPLITAEKSWINTKNISTKLHLLPLVLCYYRSFLHKGKCEWAAFPTLCGNNLQLRHQELIMLLYWR